MLTRTIAFNGSAFAVFKKFYGRRGLFFLDSSQPGQEGRFSYLGFDPFDTITGKDLHKLKQTFQKHRIAGRSILSGGAVGYLGYDGRIFFGLYDQIIAFDHERGTMTVTARTERHLREVISVLQEGPIHVPVLSPLNRDLQFNSNFSRSAYVRAVKKALDHIRRGDIYQINLSRRVELNLPHWQRHASAAMIYGVLRDCSPSPFAAYFDDGRQVILSSSPERFVKLTGRRVQVKPMKGTRPRGTTKMQDARLKKDLLQSPKEIAELLMVTDLERNDLGRVCAYGSIKVAQMRAIETYQTVFQATATIEGTLRKDCDEFDVLEAAFPSGSVTGCPKIEAMNIIRQLEGASRGLYTGALGYISFTGHMDFAVLIRTLFLQKDKISFHVGGGIVADSDPQAEYEETCVKARAMEETLRQVFGA